VSAVALVVEAAEDGDEEAATAVAPEAHTTAEELDGAAPDGEE